MKKTDKKEVVDNRITVRFTKNFTPYIKGDITKMEKERYSKLSKLLIVERYEDIM